jgi:hypothetical protein
MLLAYWNDNDDDDDDNNNNYITTAINNRSTWSYSLPYSHYKLSAQSANREPPSSKLGLEVMTQRPVLTMKIKETTHTGILPLKNL